MHNHVRLGQRRLNRPLDGVGRSMSLTHGSVGADADHHVGEVAARRLAHAQPPQLDGGLDAGDREARSLLGVGGRDIHQHVDVAPHEPNGDEEHDARDEEGGDRVGLSVAGTYEQQSDQYRSRAGEIAPEMQCVRRECGARIAAGGSRGGDRAADVDEDHYHDHEQRVPARVDLRMRTAGEARDRTPDDQEAREDEDRAFRERGQVFRLAVAVLVPGVGRPRRDADREERQERRDQVGARVCSLREQPEAVRSDAGTELQPDQGGRCEHG